MRREGKVHGWMYDIKTDKWINLKGVTDNHSKDRGRCDKAQCYFCRVHPANKSLKKAKGSMKHMKSTDDLDFVVTLEDEMTYEFD